VVRSLEETLSYPRQHADVVPVNAILYYAPFIFKGVGITGGTLSLLATGVVGIVMFLATIPAVLYVDRFGRKTILIIGGIGMAVSHFIVAGYEFKIRVVLDKIVLTALAA
jgi:MFS family permease